MLHRSDMSFANRNSRNDGQFRIRRRGSMRNLMVGFVAGFLAGATLLFFLLRGQVAPPPTLSVNTKTSSSLGSPSLTSENLSAPKVPATVEGLLEFAEELLSSLKANVQDYEARLVSREVINKKFSEGTIQIKIRNPIPEQDKGLAAYFYFLAPKSSAGREVIFVDGENENKLVAHESGLKRMMGTLKLDPDGRLAMMGQKYPAYEVGMIRLVEKLIEKGQNPTLRSQAQISITENQMIGDVPCRLIQVTIPEKSADAEFHIAQIFVDMNRMIPLRYAAYMWPEQPDGDPPLEEEYTYFDVELNVGLDDEDFSVENENYDYP